ncbi:MAG: hypothetical protein HQL31_05050 [Planctomycetes bacterium]|nr:hypothetical protein [Planctomycetota bacterium]
MNRLLNIYIILDPADDRACALENGLRKMARVFTIGHPGSAGNRGVDLAVSENPELRKLFGGLPAGLEPDLLLWLGTEGAPLATGAESLSCRKAALLLSDQESLLDHGRAYDCVLRTSLPEDLAAGHHYFPLPGGSVGWAWLMELLKVAVAGGESVPPEELAGMIEKNAPQPKPDRARRAFIIPVLDESPSSPFNIGTLLDDLRAIEGEVIAIFNDSGMAHKYASHERLDRYALMSENVGVGRAWNIGVQMSEQPVLFFLNSDLRIGKQGVDRIHSFIFENAGVGVAGPCGGQVDFRAMRELHRYTNDKINAETLVDQVSGFYFAMPRNLFSEQRLQFYCDYLPCYMEEWDMAMQLRERDLVGIRVPIDDYEHKFGGSIEARERISCLGKDYPLEEILPASKAKFAKRWEARLAEQEGVFVPRINHESR